jgi:hypothetical protein
LHTPYDVQFAVSRSGSKRASKQARDKQQASVLCGEKLVFLIHLFPSLQQSQYAKMHLQRHDGWETGEIDK